MEPQVVHVAEILIFVIVLLLINSVFSVDGEKGLLVFNDDMFVPSSFWGVVVIAIIMVHLEISQVTCLFELPQTRKRSRKLLNSKEMIKCMGLGKEKKLLIISSPLSPIKDGSLDSKC